MGNMYKEDFAEMRDNELLSISHVIENAPYVFEKGYEIRLVGQGNSHSNSGSNSGSSQCSSRSRASARVYKELA